MKKITDIDYAPKFIEYFEVNPFMCFGYTVSSNSLDFSGRVYEVWQSIITYEHKEERLFNSIIYSELENEGSKDFCEKLARFNCEATKRNIRVTVSKDNFFKGFFEANQRWFEEYEKINK